VNSTDRTISASAWEILQALYSRKDDFKGYTFEHEFWRSRAESGDGKALTQITDLVTRPQNRQQELKFLRGYGWADSELETILTRKIQHPTVRDRNLAPMYDAMANVLLSRV
jgi:hypothetical protein